MYPSVDIVTRFAIAGAALWLVMLSFGTGDRPNFRRLAATAAHCSYDNGEKCTNLNHGNNGSTASASSYNASHAREFRGHGCAAHAFVEFGAYRGGNRTFSILGLGSRPLYFYSNPNFSCEWIPAAAAGDEQFAPLQGTVMKDLPDYGYGRVYTVVVITCSFDSDVGTDGLGGDLILHAGGGLGSGTERIVALTEKPGHYNASIFDPPYPFDFLYCGSPLFGRVNPRRVREWIAYHDMVFGEKSYFVFYDAGGVHEAVRQALLPWIRLGRVSIQNVRSTVNFDGHYYNQFLMVNDCLQRSKFLANWTFFFDLDEYIYVEPSQTLHSLMAERYSASVAEISFQQSRMARYLCHSAPGGADAAIQNSSKQWGFEKMTYRDIGDSNKDVKYACNPRMVYATGVHGIEHYSDGAQQERLHNDTIARYYHYHGITATKVEVDGELEDPQLCEVFSEYAEKTGNFTGWWREKGPQPEGGDAVLVQYDGAAIQYDDAMVPFALRAKRHETAILERMDILQG